MLLVGIIAILFSLPAGSPLVSVVWSDDFEDRTSSSDFKDWIPLTPKGGNVFITLGDNKFLSGLTSGGLTIGAARPSSVAYGAWEWKFRSTTPAERSVGSTFIASNPVVNFAEASQVGYFVGVGEAFPRFCSPDLPNVVGLVRMSGNVGSTFVELASACVGPINWNAFNVLRVTRDRSGNFEFCLNGRTVLAATDNTIQTSTYFTVQIGTGGDFDDFVVHDAVLPCRRPLSATVDLDPDTLSLGSNGRFVTAYIEIPGQDLNQLAIQSVRLGGTVPAISDPAFGFVSHPEIVDRDGNGVPEIMVKFSRDAVAKIVTSGSNTLVVSGTVGGLAFEGSDTIVATGG